MIPPDGLRPMVLSWTTGVHNVSKLDGGESPCWGSEPSATTYIRYTLEIKKSRTLGSDNCLSLPTYRTTKQ